MNLNIYTYDDRGAGWRAGSWAGWLNKLLILIRDKRGLRFIASAAIPGYPGSRKIP